MVVRLPVGAARTWSMQPAGDPVMSRTYPRSSSGPDRPTVVKPAPWSCAWSVVVIALAASPLTTNVAEAGPLAPSPEAVAPWIVGKPAGSLSQILPQSVSVWVGLDSAAVAADDGPLEAAIDAAAVEDGLAEAEDVADPQPASSTANARSSQVAKRPCVSRRVSGVTGPCYPGRSAWPSRTSVVVRGPDRAEVPRCPRRHVGDEVLAARAEMAIVGCPARFARLVMTLARCFPPTVARR